MLLSVVPEGITTLMVMKPLFKWRFVMPRWLIKSFVTVFLPLLIANWVTRAIFAFNVL